MTEKKKAVILVLAATVFIALLSVAYIFFFNSSRVLRTPRISVSLRMKPISKDSYEVMWVVENQSDIDITFDDNNIQICKLDSFDYPLEGIGAKILAPNEEYVYVYKLEDLSIGYHKLSMTAKCNEGTDATFSNSFEIPNTQINDESEVTDESKEVEAGQLPQDWLDNELIGTDFWYDNVKYSDDIPDNDLTEIIEKLKKTEFVGFEEGKIHPQNGYKLSLDYPDQTIEYRISNAEHIQITITDKNAELVGTTNSDESVADGEILNTYYKISDNAYIELERLFSAIIESKEAKAGQIPQEWLSEQPGSIYIYNAPGSQFDLKADITILIDKFNSLTYTDIGKQPEELPAGGGLGFVLEYPDKTVDYWFNAGNTLWLTEGENEAVIYTIPKDAYDDIFNYDWTGMD